MAKPRVTNVIVEYLHGNKRFRVDLDPASVRAIVIGDGNFQLHYDAIVDAKPADTPMVLPNASRLIDDDAPGVRSQSGPIMVSSAFAGAGPDLWWFDGARWIHPDGDA
jgi:hypothetical protein